MIFIIIFTVLVAIAYSTLMVLYIKGWHKQRNELVPATYAATTKISVVIPARNERDHIGACLESLLAQKYPPDLFEIIVVDDHSDDGSAELIAAFANRGVVCLRLADYLDGSQTHIAYKKAALAVGIAHSHGDLMVTTDADCLAPNMWLLSLAYKFETENPAMIAAPVIYSATTGLLKVFQLIDFMGMQGVTAATHAMNIGFMSNGANLAFRKEVFMQVGGYDGIDHLASGDDYLLMMKIAKNPFNKVVYLKSEQATVTTLPQPDWYSFLQQRIRWSSKSGKYGDNKLTAALIIVYVFNVWLVVLGIGGFFDSAVWFVALVALGLKIGIEYVFMFPITAFFHRNWTRGYFPFLQPLHILYITIAGFLGFIGQYTWKDRRVR